MDFSSLSNVYYYMQIQTCPSNPTLNPPGSVEGMDVAESLLNGVDHDHRNVLTGPQIAPLKSTCHHISNLLFISIIPISSRQPRCY